MCQPRWAEYEGEEMAVGEHGKRIRGNFHERGQRCPQIILGKNSRDICVNSPHYLLKAIHNQNLHNTSSLL